MREVLLFYLPSCPHCQKALRLQEALRNAHPEYRDIPLRLADESREVDFANAHDYYYVPTYYVGEEKVHEGIVDAAIVESVFQRAQKELPSDPV